MPISTLYASPENTISDLFCAFQPKRVIVPSLPVRFGRPEMPRNDLVLGIGIEVGEDHAVRNHLDQPGAEHRRRNAEDHVVACHLAVEVILLNSASARIGGSVIAAVDHENSA